MDINQPKSRAFNIYIRFLQMGLQVLIGSKLSSLDGAACDSSFQKIGPIVTYLIIGFNIISMIIMRCMNNFPRIYFFISLILNCLFAAIIGILSFFGMMQLNTCANNRVLFRFAFMQAAISIVISVMILFLSFHWIQRYSNTPGNLVWILLFFGFGWSNDFKVPMLIQGIIFLFVSVLSFGINVLACSGITTKMKKYIVFSWIIALVFMIVGEAIGVVVYLQSTKNDIFIDNVALKLLQIFIAVNILDFIFWLWGYLTLQYENGDKIRDELMKGKNQDSEEYSQAVESYNFNENQTNPVFGTIRR